VFNKIRLQNRCALWLEHHMPIQDAAGNRPMRPFGSSVWQRWITHGRAMKYINDQAYELVKFRGDRGKREIPAGISRGGKLPVSAIWNEEDVKILRDASS
jgi:hypothetical protein